MDKNLVLVTGATGYIAGLLIPRLLKAGYPVRCMVRNKQKLAHQPWIGEVEVVTGDVSKPATLTPALRNVETAYYLIHNMSRGHGYQQAELDGADHFAQAAAQAGTQHIIYLGGLADPKAEIAPHMRSRFETGEVLRKNKVPVTEFRAGVIVGAGSISFEMIRYLCEQFPVLVGPPWLKNRTQPISAENVMDYLIAALENTAGRGQVFEIGGPEIYTYGETMLLYAKVRQLRRQLLTVPALPTALMAFVVDKLTPVPSAIAHPLIGGLNSHSTVSDPKALEVFKEIELCGYQEAIRHTLSELHPTNLERIWDGQSQPNGLLKSEGFLISSQRTHIPTPAGDIPLRIAQWVKDHYPAYEPEVEQLNGRLLFRESSGTAGMRWIEWEVQAQPANTAVLQQTSYFAPKGLAEFLSAWGWKREQQRLFRQIYALFRK
ncbi:MAG TPA: NmrA family NAD(P)-binding protein [Anaerolineales bacterium]|nr:NmrA family NAD(P)-binding protein [Anaerolineales bacterium]